MASSIPIVISASRRTDIPAFYMEDFMAGISRGYFEVTNPYNQKVSRVPAKPDEVHTIVFWSKNFGPFIEKGYGKTLKDMGYHLFFNFTINSESKILEPEVPGLVERFSQLTCLSEQFGPASITWRFDPICYYRTEKESFKNNLSDFSQIAEAVHKQGISRCITSFLDLYSKVQKRAATLNGFSFIEIATEKKIQLILKMEQYLSEKNIQLTLCCEKDIISLLPETSEVKSASCIPNDLLMKLFGGRISLRKDYGQRIKSGCGCKTSVDVGSYRDHPCRHNCLFCYANPAIDRKGCAN